ncbi:MAG: hypothetical protein L6Q54_07220 [Leptospiraceae bacterium]|nr:hypothetical protein [Leptospiraceae bacterium]MCK6381026.1 hypothetical protein [Leptospiraceae bacterium]NUM41434.1 hypothetical protein [Leptospiraceae bacterium]
MRHKKFYYSYIFFLIWIFIFIDSCKTHIESEKLFEEDSVEVQIQPEWILKNLNLVLYQKIQNPIQFRLIAILYRASYSKKSNILRVSFHPIWKKVFRVGGKDLPHTARILDRIDTFLVSVSLNEKNEPSFYSVYLETEKKIVQYDKNKYPLFSLDKFLGESIPLTIHITLDSEKGFQYPGFRQERYSNLPLKIQTRTVSEGKIVVGLRELAVDEPNSSLPLGYFTKDVWSEYYMDSFFQTAKIYKFEISKNSPLLWP